MQNSGAPLRREAARSARRILRLSIAPTSSAHGPLLADRRCRDRIPRHSGVRRGAHVARGPSRIRHSPPARPAAYLGVARRSVSFARPRPIALELARGRAAPYPLVLASVWACVRAIQQPSALNQLVLLSLLGLTTLARFQLVVVPIAALATFVVVGIRERRLIHALGEQWLVASCAAVSLALGAVLLGTGQLGPYSGALQLNLDPIGIASWAAPTALLLAYATGWLVIPGALIGLVVGIARPKSRAEGIVCVVTLLLGLGLFAQAGFVSNTITADLHERYVFYLSPLLAICFGTWLRRGAPGARWYAGLVAGLGLVALLVPLSRYSAADGKTDAAFLRALGGLENLFADVGSASAVVAAASIVGCVAALFAYRSGTTGLRMLWVGALVVGVATSASAAAFDHSNALRAERDFVGSSPSWIDRLDVDQAPLLWAKDGRVAIAHETLFWNRSVDRVVLLTEAKPVDNYAVAAGSIDADGTLRDDGEPVSGWLLVDGYASTMSFRTGVVVGDFGGLSLYRFDAPARVESQFVGRFFDGLLAPNGHITVWPTTATGDVAGRVEISLRAPANGPDRSVTFTTGGREIVGGTPAERAPSSPDADRTVLIAAGTERTLVFAACAQDTPWRLDYVASPATGDNERTVTVRSSLVFEAASSERSAACLPRPS